MKYIKEYQLFEASATAPALTQVQKTWLDKCVEGSWKLNPLTGLVDVDGDFDCEDQGLSDFKGVRFGSVEDYFDCRDNQLTSLEGAPRKVGGGFYCEDNPVSALVLKALYKKMSSGKSWSAAVVSYWRYIRSDEDKSLLAPSNPTLSPEERRGYAALARHKKRLI